MKSAEGREFDPPRSYCIIVFFPFVHYMALASEQLLFVPHTMPGCGNNVSVKLIAAIIFTV
jgi:hypothetical protein